MKDELKTVEQIVLSKKFDCDPVVVSIDEAISFLKEAKSKGAKNLRVFVASDWDGDIDHIDFETFYNRPETKEEKERRIKFETDFSKNRKLITLRYNPKI